MAKSIQVSSESSESASEDGEVNSHLLLPENTTGYGTTTKSGVIVETGADVDEEHDLGFLKDTGDKRSFTVASIIAVLLLGEFIGSADATLVIAAGPQISSEFNRLQDMSWLTSAYILAACVTQPVIGKLSDIFGRKKCILVAYIIFAIGSLICGVGSSMSQVIAGRAITGIGGGGMMTMASIVITDLVSKRDVASWRGYTNLALTLGRSLGGPVGGWVTDSIGWRWLFYLQGALILFAALLVSFKMKLPQAQDEEESDVPETTLSKLKKVDFFGMLFLATSVLSGMFLLEMGGKKFSWISPLTFVLILISIASGLSFVLTEAYFAEFPVFSLHLLKVPDVVLGYIIMHLQMVAQSGLMFFVPVYFQVSARATAAEAGSHLVPAVVGNAMGGLLSGLVIKRTGRYKPLVVSAGLIAAVSYSLLFLRWKGHTGFWESLYIFPGGFGTGVAQAAVFITVTGAIQDSEVATVISGLMLIVSIGFAEGVTVSSSILDFVFGRLLRQRLTGPGSEEIIKRAMSDTQYIASLKGKVREIVVDSYITGVHWTYLVSLISSLTAFVVAIFLKNRQL